MGDCRDSPAIGAEEEEEEKEEEEEEEEDAAGAATHEIRKSITNDTSTILIAHFTPYLHQNYGDRDIINFASDVVDFAKKIKNGVLESDVGLQIKRLATLRIRASVLRNDFLKELDEITEEYSSILRASFNHDNQTAI